MTIHRGEVGLVLEVEVLDENDVALDVSTATVKQIRIKRPAGDYLTKTASFTNDGTDGLIRYQTVAGDLDRTGTYEIQGYIELGGWKGATEKGEFEAHELFGAVPT